MTAPLYLRRRSDYKKTLDDIPTPPWVTRAFIELVVRPTRQNIRHRSVIEPACGRGHMADTLREYFNRVNRSDIKHYKGTDYEPMDYLTSTRSADFFFTNPPFKLANAFCIKMLDEASQGVGLYLKTLFVEGGWRYDNIFEGIRPTKVIVLSARMPGAKCRIIRKGSAYLSHSWFWWDKLDPSFGKRTELDWFPPDIQQRFERDEDYR